jgi:ankyrin repeat protein
LKKNCFAFLIQFLPFGQIEANFNISSFRRSYFELGPFRREEQMLIEAAARGEDIQELVGQVLSRARARQRKMVPPFFIPKIIGSVELFAAWSALSAAASSGQGHNVRVMREGLMKFHAGNARFCDHVETLEMEEEFLLSRVHKLARNCDVASLEDFVKAADIDVWNLLDEACRKGDHIALKIICDLDKISNEKDGERLCERLNLALNYRKAACVDVLLRRCNQLSKPDHNESSATTHLGKHFEFFIIALRFCGFENLGPGRGLQTEPMSPDSLECAHILLGKATPELLQEALLLAIKNAMLEFVKLVVTQYGADPGVLEETSALTPIEIALSNASNPESPEILEFLIEAGVLVPESAVEMTASSRRWHSCLFLIRRGYDVNSIASPHSHTALYWAARFQQQEVAVALLEAGSVVSRNLVGTNWGNDEEPLGTILAAAGVDVGCKIEEEDDLSLQFICRKRIRSHLLEVSHVNLFVQVDKLPLPEAVKLFLLYNVNLDAYEEERLKERSLARKRWHDDSFDSDSASSFEWVNSSSECASSPSSSDEM